MSKNGQNVNINPTHKGVVGIQNMGNTCYMNACIQLLRNVGDMSVFISSDEFNKYIINKESNYAKLTLAYQDIIRTIWSSHKPACIRPSGFLSTVHAIVKNSVYESFAMPIPNDAHEFLVFLLDNIHEATNNKYNTNISHKLSHVKSQHDVRVLANQSYMQFKSKNNSPFLDKIFGTIEQITECSKCKEKQYRYEHFNILKIPCEGNTINDWIQNEFQKTEIEDYDCEKCRPHKQKASIYRSIWKLPDTLFITIQRFNYDGTKNHKKCIYNNEPITFNDIISEYAHKEQTQWKYSLNGLIDHHGSHMGGHYTAQLCHPITKEWWLYDDESSQQLQYPHFGSPTYIMLFNRMK